MLHDETSDELPVGFTAIREFVRVAEAKLGQLQTRKEHIRSRIQALRFLAGHAERSSGHRAGRSSSTLRLPGTAPPAADSPLELQSPAFHSPDKLRRACRIALLESDTPQSCAEIYQRIKTRGSLSFDDDDNVLQVLAAQLQTMAANSEILCLMVKREMRWQWKFRSDLR